MLYADRCENGTVLCEDENGRRVKLTPDMYEGSVREGDVLTRRGGKYRTNPLLTQKRRRGLYAFQERLFGKNR